MLQTNTFKTCKTYRPNDLQETIMPAADKAEWLINVCLIKAGSSGYLNPDVLTRILE